MNHLKAEWQNLKLTNGYKVKVDRADYTELSKYKWDANRYGKSVYACRSIKRSGKVTTERMHRRIMDAPDGVFCDHVNGDGLDNRRSNLRFATRQQNGQNRSRTTSTSGYVGVTWYKSLNKWVASLRINKKHVCLGYHLDLRDAVKARNEATKDHYGEFAFIQKPPTRKEAQLIKDSHMRV